MPLSLSIYILDKQTKMALLYLSSTLLHSPISSNCIKNHYLLLRQVLGTWVDKIDSIYPYLWVQPPPSKSKTKNSQFSYIISLITFHLLQSDLIERAVRMMANGMCIVFFFSCNGEPKLDILVEMPTLRIWEVFC